MVATLSGTTVTSTGDEPNLSFLSTLPENVIEIFPKGTKTVYRFVLAGIRLQLNSGIVDYDGEDEELWFPADSATDCLRIGSGGLLRIGRETVVNGITRYSQGDALVMPRDSVAQFTIGSLDVQNGGRFEWRGGTIYAGDAMGCSIGGTAEIFAGSFVTISQNFNNTTNASAMVMRNDGTPDDVICHGVTLDSLHPTTSAPVVFSRNGLNTFIFNTLAGFAQQRSGTWTDALVLRATQFGSNAFDYDFNVVGSNGNYNVDRAQPCEFINLDIGTGLRVFAASNNLNGHVAFFQEVRLIAVDVDGNPIENAVIRTETVDHGNRIDDPRPLFQNSRTFSNGEFDLYDQRTPTNGEVAEQILIGRLWLRSSNTPQYDLYSNSGVPGVDDFVTYFASYDTLPSPHEYVLQGQEIVVRKTLLPDPSIAEPESVVSAYTSADTASQAYDSLKLAWVNSYRSGDPIPSQKVGNTLVVDGDVQVVQTGPATDRFDGGVIINSSAFVNNIEATGIVSGKEFVLGSVIDSTQDTTLRELSGATFSVYTSNADRNAQTNALAADVTSFATLFADLASPDLSISATFGNTVLPFNITIEQGANTFDASIAGQLSTSNLLLTQLFTALGQVPEAVETELGDGSHLPIKKPSIE